MICLKARSQEHPGCTDFLGVNSGRDGYLQRDVHAVCFGHLSLEEKYSHHVVAVSLHFLEKKKKKLSRWLKCLIFIFILFIFMAEIKVLVSVMSGGTYLPVH